MREERRGRVERSRAAAPGRTAARPPRAAALCARGGAWTQESVVEVAIGSTLAVKTTENESKPPLNGCCGHWYTVYTFLLSKVPGFEV